VFVDPAKVEALELRDPDPLPSGLLSTGLRSGSWLVLPVGALLLAWLASRSHSPRTRRRTVALPAAATLALAGFAAVAGAQRSAPTATPKEHLPNPARIWTTGNRFVLAPSPSASEDSRRDRLTQTHDGAFRARCPGRTRISIASGVESASTAVTVRSQAGRILRRARFRTRALSRGKRSRVARVRLAQPARLKLRVRRRGRTLRVLRRGCFPGGKRLSFHWSGKVRRGRYRVQVVLYSDRRAIRRSKLMRVR
jgi:hypothetical protein